MARKERPNGLNSAAGRQGFVRVRGAREHNLKNVDVDIPRDSKSGMAGVKRLVQVDQRPIGRTPRSKSGHVYGALRPGAQALCGDESRQSAPL
jgi:excinuclease UvrABC ATPase subunit